MQCVCRGGTVVKRSLHACRRTAPAPYGPTPYGVRVIIIGMSPSGLFGMYTTCGREHHTVRTQGATETQPDSSLRPVEVVRWAAGGDSPSSA